MGDTHFRLSWVPSFMSSGTLLFQGPHSPQNGTQMTLRASRAFRAFVVVEHDYKVDRMFPQNPGRAARTGGLHQSLQREGWVEKKGGAFSWNDTSSKMKCFTKKAVEGEALVLPKTDGDALFAVVVKNLEDNVSEELKEVFKMWDPEKKGGILRADLEEILCVLCPSLDRA